MDKLITLAQEVVDYAYMTCPACDSSANAEHCLCEFIKEHLDSAISNMSVYLNTIKGTK